MKTFNTNSRHVPSRFCVSFSSLVVKIIKSTEKLYKNSCHVRVIRCNKQLQLTLANVVSARLHYPTTLFFCERSQEHL